METYFDQFKAYLSKLGYAQPDLNKLVTICEILKFNKGKIIIKSGVKQSHIFFICEGLVRKFVFSEIGEMKSVNFRMEDMITTGYSIYAEDLKPKISVECLEDCVMIGIPIHVLQYKIDTYYLGYNLFRYLAEYHLLELLYFIENTDTKSLLERYNMLENQFPGIYQRVPQKMIALYLRTSPVHLSRIKNFK
jgi:CRP-like cAMP-binding protein